MRKLTHQELLARQAQSRQPLLPLTLVLDNIRSLHNVGSIFRMCDGAGVEKLWLCGITGYPPNSQVAKTALGAEDHVAWQHHINIRQVVLDLKSKGYQIVLLEQMEGSVSYEDFRPQQPVCLIVGNEVEGVSEEILDLADAAIEIDMQGVKNSLNVAVACGIVTYSLRRQLIGNK